MNTPPTGGFAALILALAAKYGFIGTIGARGGNPELGVFVDPATGAQLPLLLVRPAGVELAVIAWDFAGAPGCIPFVLSRQTYNVLHEGVTGSDSTVVTYQGRDFRIEATWDGFRPVAQAVAVSG